jgi:hypothetical protein
MQELGTASPGQPRALAGFGIDVPVPQVERLEDVAVRVDHVVRTRHWQTLSMVLLPTDD